MKALLLSLALLTGDVPWDAKLESFAGITCPTRADAERIERIQQSYLIASTLRHTRCVMMAFQGRRLGETEDFSIGGILYSFTVVEYEGYEVYVLEERGEGWTA